MKAIGLSIIFCLCLTGLIGQVELVESNYQEESSPKPSNIINIISAYWKDGNYHIKFNVFLATEEIHEQSITFKDGKLNLIFKASKTPEQGDYHSIRQYYYQVKGLPDKNFKLRFNGFRMASYPIPPPPPEVVDIDEYRTIIDLEEIVEIPDEAIFAKPGDPIVDFPEIQPLWENCEDVECSNKHLLKFISSNTKYPAMAREMEIQGKVFLQFIVETSGEISGIKVIKGVDKYLDKEAMRVIKSFPNWIPAKNSGKNVRSTVNIPILFKLV